MLYFEAELFPFWEGSSFPFFDNCKIWEHHFMINYQGNLMIIRGSYYEIILPIFDGKTFMDESMSYP